MMSSHRLAGRRDPRGLTLIELMIALAVTTVLATLAVPSYGQMMARQRLKSAAENLAIDLAELHLQATQRGVPLHLHVAPGADWCYATAVASGCDCHVPQQCQIKTVHAKDHPGVALVEGQDLQFDVRPSLLAGPAAAVLQSAEGQQLRVALTPLGRAKVCAPAGAVAGYAAC